MLFSIQKFCPSDTIRMSIRHDWCNFIIDATRLLRKSRKNRISLQRHRIWNVCVRQVYMVKRSKTKKLSFIVSNLCIWCKTILFPLVSSRKLSYNIEETCASYFNKETGSSCIYYPQCNLFYRDGSCKTKLFELSFRERRSVWLVTAPVFIVFVVFFF